MFFCRRAADGEIETFRVPASGGTATSTGYKGPGANDIDVPSDMLDGLRQGLARPELHVCCVGADVRLRHQAAAVDVVEARDAKTSKPK